MRAWSRVASWHGQGFSPAVAAGRSVAGMLADFCWPPACLVCGVTLPSAKLLICPRCDESVSPHGVVCRVCGSGLSQVPPGGGTPGGRPGPVCRDCREHAPPFLQARSYGPHTAPLSVMLYHLKYRHRPALAPLLAERLAEVVQRAGWNDVDAIVPVPTTRWRRWRRGYNQAELLARDLGALVNLPVLGSALIRRHGRSQVGADYAQRARNVRGRFRVRDDRGFLHRRVLLVDDVLTTGATAHEVSATIMAAGARKVYLVTLTSTGRTHRHG